MIGNTPDNCEPSPFQISRPVTLLPVQTCASGRERTGQRTSLLVRLLALWPCIVLDKQRARRQEFFVTKSTTFDEFFAAAMGAVDHVAWDRLRAEYSEVADGVTVDNNDMKRRFEINYSKYFDLDYWFRYHWRHAKTLGLDQSDNPQRVLDLGCGAGIFLYVCQQLGSSGAGIDIEMPMYQQMAGVLGVDYLPGRISPMTPLPAALTGFDVISAIAIKFDRPDFADRHAKVWQLAEWKFFLADLKTRLNPGGRLYIKPNLTAEGSLFSDGTIEPYLTSISDEVTPHADFIILKDSIEG
jgi:SAM-dependent methyltransferase